MLRGRYIVGTTGIFLIFHLLCHFLNWYFLIWWTDIAAHFLAGATAGLFWWWLIERKKSGPNIGSSTDAAPDFSWINCVSIVSFATFISALWEFWEFSNWRFTWLRETTGQLQIQYQPILGNNLSDITWGLCGGIAIAIIYLISVHRNIREFFSGRL